ncbi:MAG: gluconolaconase, partial [Caulobacteraceae bacterium]|nr:gluconolaconase [Caulobacteraceae bacterium]
MKAMFLALALGLGLSAAGAAHAAGSAFTSAPNDPRAVTLQAKGDGVTDDTAAIQAAIDQAATGRGGGGIVIIPSGRYRISKTVFVWPAVRVFGVGPTRPVMVLGANTPGFQQGAGTMFYFAGSRPPGAGFGGGAPAAAG